MKRPSTAYCGWCRSEQPFRIPSISEDPLRGWTCKTCDFAIDCDECGQTMSDDHDCAAASDPERH